MAKAVITREIEYQPANPAARCKRIDITKIENIDISKADRPGRTVIYLKSGHKRYSNEDVISISKAYHKAKGDEDVERESENRDGSEGEDNGLREVGGERGSSESSSSPDSGAPSELEG